ncbi:response regulator transcription factor [Oceanispirochaeta sp.]|jgi:two-component system invasion response regulator UvrY|uniref:response regulator n=1 Tax=Oceanispirochaeta sp. TaxID=2035350 RepID=UPI002637C86D|nr:response regulator transcription factor [Oceanispirochaeta sp.]MDA3955290.1 response regulator transcription factor [Oceanispirochaeta sp.]
MHKILIVDDHPLVRRGLCQILQESISLSRLDELSNGVDVLSRLSRQLYDVIILDISLPGKDGLEVLKDLHIQYPEIPVLILSIQSESQYALRALKLGASGCLNKASAPEELVKAVKEVNKGGRYISPKVSHLLLEDYQGDHSQMPHKQLSEREYQVMIMLVEGLTSGEISTKLNLSIKTVSTYRARLLQKMNLKNNSQLIYYAVKHNLISQN